MAITILNELSIDLDGESPGLTLWLVSYEKPLPGDHDRWEKFVAALGHFCARHGWQLEHGDDPYREKSLAIFAEGFSRPDDDLIGWDLEDWEEE